MLHRYGRFYRNKHQHRIEVVFSLFTITVFNVSSFFYSMKRVLSSVIDVRLIDPLFGKKMATRF